jgi:predicted nucleic acid-binding Zn finger protein
VNSQPLRDELIERFSQRSASRKYLERAVDAVLEGRVKKHRFIPSGRVLHTVVGRSGDEFIDPEKPFCSCQHFFFSVLGGRDQTCYHLLANSIATDTHRYVQTEFHDEEFRYFLKLLSSDLLSRSGDKEGAADQDESKDGGSALVS